jgi:biopolymer transport protein ExbB
VRTVLIAQAAAVEGTSKPLWQQAIDLWVAGDWGMLAIAINAMLMFGLGLDMWLRFQALGYRRVPEKVWRLWLEHPKHREGKLGRLLERVTERRTLEGTAAVFQGLRSSEIAPFARDLRVMKVCVAAAPLLGLFGTVTGMLATFGALANGSGGEKTMLAVSRGISEALITTETGLVVALPGLFFQYQLSRQKERYGAFLAHLETVCTQYVYKRLRKTAAA